LGYTVVLEADDGVATAKLPAKFGYNVDGQIDKDWVTNKTQNFRIVLEHVTTTEVNKVPVTQTIDYVYGNGPDKGHPAAKSYEKTYEFTSTTVTDKVTGEKTTTWSPAQESQAVESPKAYNPSYVTAIKEIPSETITHDSVLKPITVEYFGEEDVTIHYIDVTGIDVSGDGYTPESGVALDHDQKLQGEPGAEYKNTLWDYAAAGYKLVYAQPGSKDGKFDNDANTPQDYYVYLAKPASIENVTVTRTINVHNPDGKTNTTKQPVVVSRTVTTNVKTGEKVYGPWTTGEWKEFTTPDVANYTPDISYLNSKKVDGNTPDETVDIYYETQNAKVVFWNDTTGTPVEMQSVNTPNGCANTDIDFSSSNKVLEDYLKQGYVLVPDQSDVTKNGMNQAKFDNDSKVDQVFNVHLVEGTETTTVEKVITRTIVVHNPDGTEKTTTQSATISRTVTTNKVTGEKTYGDWTTGKWDSFDTPEIKDYTPDIKHVDQHTVVSTDKDTRVDIYYEGTWTAEPQKITYTVIDDATGKTLEFDVDLTEGNVGEKLTTADKTKYEGIIKSYQDQGYVLVSADRLPGTFPEGDASNMVIHLTHGQKTVEGTPVTKTETIRYIDNHGNQMAENVTFERTFTPILTVDTVTGEVIKTVWNGDGSVDSVVSPTISGYTPDQLVVSGQLLAHDGENLNFVVVYTPEETPEKPTPKEVTPPTPAKPVAKETVTPKKEKEAPAKQLPQTGDETSEAAVLMGLGLISGSALLGATELGRKRRKEN
ncbi:LPXTG cell wall anchor domain-containing protein, partial [Ligilactobacillus equi]|uniref:mucin-binding protein n=1 Tax=Ligilactobacillus equi TaxID=137357 RepID=UPI002ED1D850